MQKKSKSYLTMHYFFSRIIEKLYRLFFPTQPWLSPAVNQYLSQNLKSSWIGFEYGSGRSTLWFAKRVASLTSVEHNPDWFRKLSRSIMMRNLSNVKLVLCEREQDKEPEGNGSKYVSEILKTPDSSLDFALVDGVYRAECCKNALHKLKPGGLLIIDDCHRYLPSKSHSPYARKMQDGPATESWSKIFLTISQWDCFWTSNGVSDSAVFFKPGKL